MTVMVPDSGFPPRLGDPGKGLGKQQDGRDLQPHLCPQTFSAFPPWSVFTFPVDAEGQQDSVENHSEAKAECD